MTHQEVEQRGRPLEGGARVSVLLVRALVPVAVLALGVVGFLAEWRMKKPPARGPEEGPLRIVRVLRVEPKELTLTIHGDGTAVYRRVTKVSPLVGGRIVSISPSLVAGGFVKEGDVLFEIDPVDYELAVRQAKVEVERCQADIELLEQERKDNERLLAVVRDHLKLAQADVARAQSLLHGAVAPQSQVDAAKQAFLALKDEEVGYENVLAEIPLRRRQLERALDLARLRLKKAELDLDRTKVRAPYDALVISASVEVGTVVSPNQPAATIADYRSVEVPAVIDVDRLFDLPITSDQIASGRLNLRLPATVRWQCVSGICEWRAEIVRVEPINPLTRTVPIVARVLSPAIPSKTTIGPRCLQAGMFCSVELQGKKVQGAILIPRTAIHEGNKVYLLIDGKLKTVKVEVDRRIGSRALIGKGLRAGDLVILSRIMYPVDGMALKAQQCEKPTEASTQ